MMDELYTERVYVDPERLMRLKKERKPLKMVPSVFEPPREPPTEASLAQVQTSEQREQKIDNNLLEEKGSYSANADFIVSLLGGMGVTNESVV